MIDEPEENEPDFNEPAQAKGRNILFLSLSLLVLFLGAFLLMGRAGPEAFLLLLLWSLPLFLH